MNEPWNKGRVSSCHLSWLAITQRPSDNNPCWPWHTSTQVSIHASLSLIPFHIHFLSFPQNSTTPGDRRGSTVETRHLFTTFVTSPLHPELQLQSRSNSPRSLLAAHSVISLFTPLSPKITFLHHTKSAFNQLTFAVSFSRRGRTCRFDPIDVLNHLSGPAVLSFSAALRPWQHLRAIFCLRST